MPLKTLSTHPVQNKRVLLRVDYNITLKKDGNKKIVGDDTRIRATLPTINHLLKNNCSIIIMTWFKRPEGKIVEEYRLDPMAEKLAELLGRKVSKLNACVGPEVDQAVHIMKPGEIIMLENTRFEPGEKKSDAGLAKIFASYGEVVVFDAFPQAHREHASTTGLLAEAAQSIAGFLFEEEIRGLTPVRENPKHPFVAVLGGAKISDKVKIIETFITKCETILIGGALANTFLKAQGKNIGGSLTESECMDKKGKTIDPLAMARDILEKGKEKVMIPVDFVAAPKLEAGTETKIINIEKGENIPENWMYLDIGPASVKKYQEVLSNAETIFWNGPLGAFETAGFDGATKEIARAIAKRTGQATTVTGGGDTEAAIKHAGTAGKYTHSSTGGGASLKYIAGENLPVLKYLTE